MKLLICIPFHYSPDRLKYITHVLNYFVYFYDDIKIIIDTNTDDFDYKHTDVEIKRHYHLAHPFHLTMLHRQHFLNHIDEFENFMYIEDDILLPYENYKNYMENFEILFPLGFVPSFVRIEKNNGQEYITDATQSQKLEIRQIGSRQYTQMKAPYHGFWIMPAKELKETLTSDFTRLHESREHAASYPMWGLKKTPLVQIELGLISQKCYSYHLPCNYALSAESQFAKIKPENIFI